MLLGKLAHMLLVVEIVVDKLDPLRIVGPLP
jgi:hypothetical protein